MSRDRASFLDQLAAVPVVAILRAAGAGRFLEVGRVLYEGGVRAIEVTLTSEGALAAFGRLREELPGDALLGGGTVRSAGDAERAVEAGATYLVAPDFRPEVVGFAVERGIPVVPGALTPTEVAAAWAAGSPLLVVLRACRRRRPHSRASNSSPAGGTSRIDRIGHAERSTKQRVERRHPFWLVAAVRARQLRRPLRGIRPGRIPRAARLQ